MILVTDGRGKKKKKSRGLRAFGMADLNNYIDIPI